MAKLSGISLGIALCNIIGVNPNDTVALTLECMTTGEYVVTVKLLAAEEMAAVIRKYKFTGCELLEETPVLQEVTDG